jgi:hypothetical protein
VCEPVGINQNFSVIVSAETARLAAIFGNRIHTRLLPAKGNLRRVARALLQVR